MFRLKSLTSRHSGNLKNLCCPTRLFLWSDSSDLNRCAMEDLSEIYVTDFIPTIYSTPAVIDYVQNGKPKKKAIFAERNGVLIVVYNKTRDTLILVKQFRASAYLNCIPKEERLGKIDTEKYPPKLGVTLEFCAGLEDKDDASTEQIAKEEILEECGYEVENLEKVNTFKNLVGSTTGARTTLYYCEVTDDMKVAKGGGVDDEIIDVIEMPVKDVLEYATKEYVSSPCNFLYALYWFLFNKYNKSL